ncbi:uncharacterized protein LOC121371719 [Gigantopelta aegis]|uniref:uncharacterized protein LOC121371719 n=1 Tax=Gigantopelta aegis TaxID=1735272 RepID=UPI001B88C543|nr:uncharacterized protein LOC121371719 [Gigantopelta aegis]
MEPVQKVELSEGAFEIGLVTPEKKDGKFLQVLEEWGDLDLPTGPKRRKMNGDTPSSILSSRSGSPSLFEWCDDSRSSTPGGSPAPRTLAEFKKYYRKDELWKAIEPSYQYLMDKEIIETCRSTESDLSLDEDDHFAGGTNISFDEFLEQYRDLTEWLRQIQVVTQRKTMSLSEKYLIYQFGEVLSEKVPRRKFLIDYAKQLLCRYPHMNDEINSMTTFLNNQWHEVESAIVPSSDYTRQTMITDLQADLNCLRKWLYKVEKELLPLVVRPEWSHPFIKEKLKEHQVLQQEIESHSQIVSVVIQLSEQLQNGATESSDRCESLSHVANGLQRRWHGIWLQSLEWQYKLEETLEKKDLPSVPFNVGHTLPSLDELDTPDYDSQSPNSGGRSPRSWRGDLSGEGYEELDDSLLYLGRRSDLVRDTPNHLDVSYGSLCKRAYLDKSSGDSANISEAESKMEDSLSADNASIVVSHSSESEMDVVQRVLFKTENRDIGYSSESHSNDETELMRIHSMLENRYPGKCEVASDSPCSDRSPLTERKHVNFNSRHNNYYMYSMVPVDIESTDKTTDEDVVGSNNGKLDSFPAAVTVSSKEEVPMEKFTCSVNSGRMDLEIDDTLKAFLNGGSSSQSSEVEGGTDPQEKIKILIEKVEDLVRTSPVKIGVVPSPVKEVRSIGCNTVSSCDASGEEASCEETDDHNSEDDEFSTASDDIGTTATDDNTETLFDSVIGLDYTSDSKNTSYENVSFSQQTAEVLNNVRLRDQMGPRKLKDRPWSVIEMQEFTKMLDSQPYSTSESAIDRITHSPSKHKSQFLYPERAATVPRQKHAPQTFQRSLSMSEQTSPRAAKRKLRYSSTQNKTSAVSGADSNVSVPSIEWSSEDDVAHPVSETDDMVDRFQLTQVKSSSGASSSSCESDTSDDYLTPPMDPPTSENEDILNSTGSFSENAWDNYQAPLYPSVSEDLTEEKIHWEPIDEMEFDEEIHLDGHRSSILGDAIAKRATSEKRKAKLTMAGSGHHDDSDSDMEDFHYILDQSCMQLKLADQSLKKKRKNSMGTHLHLTPAKYAEIIATCETNIRCLKSISAHLDSKDVTEKDVLKMQDLLYQWEKLQALASERQVQSTQLASILSSMSAIKKRQQEVATYVHTKKFSSAKELEALVEKLKEQQVSLEKEQQATSEVAGMLEEFGEQYPAIPLKKFIEELADIEEANSRLQISVVLQLSEQSAMLKNWYKYLECRHELESLVSQDRERLQKLVCQRDNGRRVQHKDLIAELENLQGSLGLYECKLENIQSLRCELQSSSDEETQKDFLASLADLRNQLFVFTKTCRETKRDVEDEEDLGLEETQIGQLAMSAATLREKIIRRNKLDPEDLSYQVISKHSRDTTSRSWLRSAPLQFTALALLAGMVYLMDSDIVDKFFNFSIRISPELRYVNGPPPF